MNTELTVVQRASVALGAAEHEKALLALAQRSVGIVGITNEDSYKELHSARMALKRERLSIEKLGKDARDDAQKFSKAVIQEERRLIGIIEPEESRLLRIQTDHVIAVEKVAREREDRIRREIDRIKGLPMSVTRKPAAEISGILAGLRAEPLLPDFYAEFLEAATLVREGALVALEAMERDAIAHEEETARLVAHRADLERREAEHRQREAEEDARRRAAREREEAELAERRRVMQAEEDRLAAARREIEEQQATARRAQEDRERAERAEADRLVREQAERDRLAQAKIDDEARAARLEAAGRADARELLGQFQRTYGARPEFAGVVKAIGAYFKKNP